MDINSILAKMRASGAIEKGALGEDAVWSLLCNRPNKCLLYNSVRYPYQTDRNGVVYLGNIKYDNGEFYDISNEDNEDEIDCVYITRFKIFLIEVKSYHAKRIDVYDHWINRVDAPMDKSPVAQAEKHARHFYHAVYDVIPDGDPNYIVPVVCFVDRTLLRDARSSHFKTYVPVCTLNSLNKVINKYNQPLKYELSFKDIKQRIKDISISIAKEV